MKFWKICFITLLAWIGPVALAADGAFAPRELAARDTAAVRSDGQTELYCARFNGFPRQCAREWVCAYDYRGDRCWPRDGGSGGGLSCNSYDYDPNLCQQVSGCYYDRSARRCREGYGPGPGPTQCWRYSDRPRVCDDAPGCRWDRVSAECRDDFGGRPRP